MKNKKIYTKQGFITIRPYLTTNEINGIINTVSSIEDYATRKMAMYAMVLSLTTDIKDFNNEQENIDIEIVENYINNGIYSRIIRYIFNYNTLIEAFDKIDIVNIYKKFENVIGDFTKQFKDINLDESMKNFETELGKLQKVQKEKEMILNGK